MPIRTVSSPLRPNEKSHSGSGGGDVPKQKKSGHKTKSATASPGSLFLSCDHADLASAMTTQNGEGASLLITTHSGHGGNQSLNSTCRDSDHDLPTPKEVTVLGLEQDGFQVSRLQHLNEPAPRLDASHSNSASLCCTTASASLPTVHKDPINSSDLHPPQRKATSAEVVRKRRSGGGVARKDATLTRAGASQPNMFNTSPADTSLGRVSSPSPEEAALARTEPSPQQLPLRRPPSRAAATTSEAVMKSRKYRTPSPQPHPQMDTIAPSAAAGASAAVTTTNIAITSAAKTPTTTSLTPSPRPLEAKSQKPLAGVTAKATSKAWSPPMNTHEAPEYLPTDAPNIVVPAHKYAYDVKTCTWKEIDTMIRVLHPNRGVSQGAMRVCFVVEELDERGFSTPMVAKMFRHHLKGIVESDYFNEGEAQCICGTFADKYNKVELPKEVDRFVISFLQCDTVRIRPCDLPEEYRSKRTGFFSYRTTDSRDILFTMEPRLNGNFTKYTNNYGAVYEGFEQRLDREKEEKRHKVLMAAEAFSHFTLEDSGGSLLVCDLQGVNDFLTDPQIHTEDGKGLGMGNMGLRGINKWVEKHECNDMCRALGLQPLKGPKQQVPPSPAVEARVSYYKILRSNLRMQAPTRPEDLIPLPKPLSEMTDEERLDYAIRLSQLLS